MSNEISIEDSLCYFSFISVELILWNSIFFMFLGRSSPLLLFFNHPKNINCPGSCPVVLTILLLQKEEKLPSQQVLFCCFVEAKFSAWNLFKLTFYSKFGFSRPDLDGNKLAKGMCLCS